MMIRIMGRRTVTSYIAWMLVSCLTVIGCSAEPSSNSSTSTDRQEAIALTISAAASMQDALNAIQIIYEENYPGNTLVYNFASSGSLQQQIEQGAPVDVFLSASPKQMNALEEKSLLLDGTRQDLLKNTIVLVTPLEQSAITSFDDLSKDVVTQLSIGEPNSVPAGQYSREVLESLGLYQSIQTKTVFAKNVRQVLSYVETGNVDAGLIYSTDANISEQVQIVATAPDDAHSPIVYPGAVIADSQHPAAATEFVQFLGTQEAIAIFIDYGFLPAAQ
ncbi:MAG: molybdate ABC transporter substrate-binding protein [Cyanobacteria bacterium J06633_2]